MFFQYGDEEISYLKSKDERLSRVIDFVGFIKEPLELDPFRGIIYHILGQQISVRVQDSIWDKLNQAVDPITPETILAFGKDNLRALGMTNRKAETIIRIAEMLKSGELDFSRLEDMSDEDIIKELTKIKGIGKWTVEMLIMFSLNRKNVFTFGDVALNRGLKMVYGLDKISKEQFEYFKHLFDPYGTIASLYFWAIGENKREGIPEFIADLNTEFSENEQTDY